LAIVVHGVGNGGSEDLGDNSTGLALNAIENLGSAINVLASDEVKNLTRLTCRHVEVPKDGLGPWTLVRLRAGHRRPTFS
jgi:hypothetical protein